MMAPGAQHQCVGCSLDADHMTAILPHLENHDVSYAVVARAPIEELVRKRMGWKFLWVSSFNNDFNYDFDVSFRPEDVAAGRARYNYRAAPEWTARIQDLSGRSVFYKTKLARYSIPTPPIVAAARMPWEFTACLMRCRKAATRQGPIIH
jgi:predicted dithiol-disulfide oxidoreductase (DUF899 family)